jgi:Domain of unknown function (DUF4440)
VKNALPFWFVLLLLGSATAVAGSRESDERALVAAETARMEAMVAGDFASLERVLGDDLTYGHSSGQVQGKAELIGELRSGVRRYRALTAVESAARAYGCAGVVTGTTNIEAEFRGQPVSFTLRYTATYARQQGHWVLVAYQSVRLP